VLTPKTGQQKSIEPVQPAPADMGDVHLSLSENLKIRCDRDGTCEYLEVKGNLVLTAHSAEGTFFFIIIIFCALGLFLQFNSHFSLTLAPKHIINYNNNNNTLQQPGRSAEVQLNRGKNLKDFRLQPNPNVNKKAWSKQSLIAPKNEQKLFPIGKSVPVLRWRMEKRNEEDTPYLPISVNAWPEAGSKSTVVNVEFNLEREDMVLHNFVISIPLGTSETPEITSVDGTTRHNRREECLEWYVDVVDSNNSSGTINFEIAQPDEDVFFPMQVSFQCKKPLIELAPGEITCGGKPLKSTSEAILNVASFEIGSEE